MEILLGVVVGLVLLTLIVVIHELGHAIVARRNGVVVEEFGIGFPPRAKAWKVKKSFLGKNVTYSLNWLPIGGFVKLQGEHDADRKKGDYGAASFWAKTKILLAGVVMNWLTAAVLLSILAVFGVPKLVENQFSVDGDTYSTRGQVTLASVLPGSPAEKAGLKFGDKVLKVDGKTVDNPDKLRSLTKQNAGKQVKMDVVTESGDKQVEVKLGKDQKKGYLGAVPSQSETLRSTWSAPIVGVGLTWQLTDLTLRGLGDLVVNLFTGVVQKFSSDEQARQQAEAKISKAGNSLAGPVGLLGMIMPGIIKAGLPFIILIVAIISISLAVFNFLPIPALDGGRWFVTMIYKLLGKDLTQEAEEKIHGTGMMFLLFLFLLITIADIWKFF
ncbi:hypothetical protein CR956_00935 [Candidatus Saccharibacteria bacterium]|nr:MAG: hypothetical protein CR956_00935 [Candidatus Saccharibacteria bacterium]